MAASQARQFERAQIRHAYDGSKAGAMFRSSLDRASDPVSRRTIGLSIAGGVRIEVWLDCGPIMGAWRQRVQSPLLLLQESPCHALRTWNCMDCMGGERGDRGGGGR